MYEAYYFLKRMSNYVCAIGMSHLNSADLQDTRVQTPVTHTNKQLLRKKCCGLGAVGLVLRHTI